MKQPYPDLADTQIKNRDKIYIHQFNCEVHHLAEGVITCH